MKKSGVGAFFNNLKIYNQGTSVLELFVVFKNLIKRRNSFQEILQTF